MRIRSPQALRPYVWTLRYALRFVRHIFGQSPRECTVCGHSGRFFAFGAAGDELGRGFCIDALCPKCLSLERHRLLALCDRQRNLFKEKKVLHFAPESGLQEYIKAQNPRSYTSCDLIDPAADIKVDIEDIGLPDKEFEVICCSHVLEHVDDARAIPELYRILTSGGLLIAMVPIVEGWETTFEEKSKTANAHDRVLYYGQYDHVRFYGKDISHRFCKAGFSVEEFVAKEPDVSRHGLMRGEKVFLCRKR